MVMAPVSAHLKQKGKQHGGVEPCCVRVVFNIRHAKHCPRTSNHLRHAKKENRNEQNWLFHTYDPGIPTSGHFLSRTVTLEWTLGP